MELSLNIDPRGRLTEQLYRELRNAILESRLSVGARLPSSRELAERLRLSRNTVNQAYERLVSEGFLVTRQGAGTYVSGDILEYRDPKTADGFGISIPVSAWAKRLTQSQSIVPQRNLPYDFRPGLPEMRYFPIHAWRRYAARNLRTLSQAIAHYGDSAGNRDLRVAIARYIAYSRAVPCGADDIVITSGSQQALDLLGRVLVDPGTTVAIEDPTYPAAASVFRAMGARVIPVPVDNEGVQVEWLPNEASVVYVTPSHQFPLGVTLSMSRRIALIEWATEHRAVIIEDDYDSEFRFGGRPLESLKGLDRAGVVTYLGTFSKVLFPGLRLGYMVASPSIRDRVVSGKWMTDRHTPALEQCMMRDFIVEGHFAKYMRRMEKVYAQRQSKLLGTLKRETREWLDFVPSHAGLHVTAFLPQDFDDATLVQRAYATGVGLYSIRPFYQNISRPGLIFGYGGCTDDDISEGVSRLRYVFESMVS